MTEINEISEIIKKYIGPLNQKLADEINLLIK